MKKRKLGFEEQLIRENLNSVKNINKDFKRDMGDFGGRRGKGSHHSYSDGRSKHMFIGSYDDHEEWKRRELHKKENKYLFFGGLAFILIGLFTFKNNVSSSIFFILFGIFLSYLGNKASRKRRRK